MAHWQRAFQRKYGYPASEHTQRMADETRRLESLAAERDKQLSMPGRELPARIPTTFPVSLGGGIWTS